MTRLVILDRDGVINFDSKNFIKSPDEWQPIPGSITAIARLHRKGIKVYIATNQSGIGRGLLQEKDLQDIHQKMIEVVERAGGKITGIEYCPHHPNVSCPCRKPKPGMLFAIQESSGLSIMGQPCVGDSLRDLVAAEAAGCRPVLILTGNSSKIFPPTLRKGNVYKSLLEFVDSLE